MLEITTGAKNEKADPLGIHLSGEGPSLWEANTLTSLIATRIIALGNRVDGLLGQELFREARLLMSDIQSLANVIKDIQQWPFIHGQSMTFKYGHVYYTLSAQSPNQYEGIERAKNHFLKSAQIKKDS